MVSKLKIQHNMTIKLRLNHFNGTAHLNSILKYDHRGLP